MVGRNGSSSSNHISALVNTPSSGRCNPLATVSLHICSAILTTDRAQRAPLSALHGWMLWQVVLPFVSKGVPRDILLYRGHQNENDARYCTSCGNQMPTVSIPPPQPSPARRQGTSEMRTTTMVIGLVAATLLLIGGCSEVQERRLRKPLKRN